MPEPLSFARGPWWRCSAYEIRDGYIRPGEGAEIEEYDPWELWARDQEAKAPVRSPYHDLLDVSACFDLEEGLRTEGKWIDRIELNDEANLLRWCTRYGLLGVLHCEAVFTYFYPRWTAAPPQGGRGLHYVPSQLGLLRQAGDWEWDEIHYDVPREDPSLEGAAVDMTKLTADERAEIYVGSAIVDRGLHLRYARRWGQESVAHAWGRFFPNIGDQSRRDTAEYPEINTPAFWASYSERIEDFAAAAILLTDTILKEFGGEDLWSHTLEHFLSPLGLRADPTADGFRQMSVVSPSLVSTLALMAMLDLTRAQRLHSCPICNTYFSSATPRARYCSVRCRQTAQKRAYRQRVQRQPAR